MVLSNQLTIIPFLNVWPRIFTTKFAAQQLAHNTPRPALIRLRRWQNYHWEVNYLLHTSIKQTKIQLSSPQAVSQCVTCLPQLHRSKPWPKASVQAPAAAAWLDLLPVAGTAAAAQGTAITWETEERGRMDLPSCRDQTGWNQTPFLGSSCQEME